MAVAEAAVAADAATSLSGIDRPSLLIAQFEKPFEPEGPLVVRLRLVFFSGFPTTMLVPPGKMRLQWQEPPLFLLRNYGPVAWLLRLTLIAAIAGGFTLALLEERPVQAGAARGAMECAGIGLLLGMSF